jgi:lysophospholipase L1-like esterase
VFANTVAAQTAAGNTISTITITLGFNELAALAPMGKLTPGAPLTPAVQAAIARIPATLATYKTNYTNVLTQVRTLAPNADLFLLGYFDPFPADPTSPAGPIFAAGGTALNNTMQGLAAEFGAHYVDTFAPFVGHEAQYTFEGQLPTGATIPDPFGGPLPIGDVHPNALGYSVIAGQVAAASTVPEPSAWAVLAAGLGVMGMLLRRRSAKAA